VCLILSGFALSRGFAAQKMEVVWNLVLDVV
jgi:hypothetical protein